MLFRSKLVVYSEEELLGQNLILVKESQDLNFRNSEVTKWKSAAGIPIGANQGYSILFQIDVTKVDFAFENLRILESLLNAYESLVYSNSTTESTNSLLGKNLTKRQEEILSQIRSDKTNLQIALDLGYSESLIRQETMIIYKKLGVTGRKEIRETS